MILIRNKLIITKQDEVCNCRSQFLLKPIHMEHTFNKDFLLIVFLLIHKVALKSLLSATFPLWLFHHLKGKNTRVHLFEN